MKIVRSRFLKLIFVISLFQPLTNSYALSNKELYKHLKQGHALLASKHYEEAMIEYDKANQIDLKNPLPYYAKGNLLTEMREFLKANVEYDKALTLDKGLSKIHTNKALNFMVLNDYDKALSEIDKAIDAGVDQFTNFTSKCIVLYKIRKFNEAIPMCNKAIKLDSSRSEFAYLFKGKALINIEEYSNALESLNAAIKLNNKFASAYIDKGFTYKILEKKQEALTNFKKAISLDPSLGPIEKYMKDNKK